jgi:alpha-beta hydrolase superfamily lysophospholipase
MVRTNDGLSLFTQSWSPDGYVRAAVVLAHGYAEHSGRYGFLGDSLAKVGIKLVAHDSRGHGRSEGPWGSVPSIAVLANDFCRVVKLVRADNPGLPVILFGHSMGGLVATMLAADEPGLHDLLVISSPYFRPTLIPSKGQVWLVRLLAAVVPKVPVKYFNSNEISRIPEVVKLYDADPLVNRRWLMARSAFSLIKGGEEASRRARDLKRPLLLVHGGRDQTASPSASRDFVAEAASADKTLRIYEDSSHEVFNDLDGPTVLDDVVTWLEKRIGT